MSVITEDRIRQLDTDYIANLIAENKMLKEAIEQQRTDMTQLHHTIGRLECKLQGKEAAIRLLKRENERLNSQSILRQ